MACRHPFDHWPLPATEASVTAFLLGFGKPLAGAHAVDEARMTSASTAAPITVRFAVLAWCACGDGVDIRDPVVRDRYWQRMCDTCAWLESEGDLREVGPRPLSAIRDLARRRELAKVGHA